MEGLEKLFIIIFALICFLLGWGVGHVDGYQQGQIDAINGEIYYELQIQPDSTKVWVEIKK